MLHMHVITASMSPAEKSEQTITFNYRLIIYYVPNEFYKKYCCSTFKKSATDRK